ncbi:MAG: hypothetical protein ACREM8_14550 [Vulcanimicrobiaceae bacterium]
MWLPRLLEKARRIEQLRATERLVDGYCYGVNDFIDKGALEFLRTDDVSVSALVRLYPDDVHAARIIVERSGRSPAERRAFSRRLRRQTFDFGLLEADEGRMAPGLGRAVIRFAYNVLMMPAIYASFRRAERKRNRKRSVGRFSTLS